MRQHAPSTASTNDVENGIQNLRDGVLTLPSPIGFGLGNQWLDSLPFGICQVARVRFSCVALFGHNGRVYPNGRDPSIFRHALTEIDTNLQTIHEIAPFQVKRASSGPIGCPGALWSGILAAN